MLVVDVLNGKKHDRKKFNCGNQELNAYLKQWASQDVRDGYCQVYVVAEERSHDSKQFIYGFFTISQTTLEYNQITELPTKLKKRYSTIPAILIGRLAKNKNQTILSGAELLLLALREAKSAYAKLGGVFIVIHAKDRRAKNFYTKHGFYELPSNPNTLILPIKEIP